MGAKINNLMQQYGIVPGNSFASGGRVRTHYQTGGEAEVSDPLADLDAFYSNPSAFSRPPPARPPGTYRDLQRAAAMNENVVPPSLNAGEPLPVSSTENVPLSEWQGSWSQLPQSNEMPVYVTGEEPAGGNTGNEPAAAAAPPPAASASPLEGMLARYLGPTSGSSQELADARRRSQSESEAFSNMIRQMADRGESSTSRAEMYFRLASAFGAPTKTGTFGETLSNVGKELGEYTKGRRADEAERRGLMLKAQEARMAGAREELSTTRALVAQEATERRAIANSMLQEYIRSGRPQSNAGRAALDAGLRPGTPEFQDYVRRQTELDIARTEQLIQTQAENMRLRDDQRNRLSDTEIRLQAETMQNISSARDNAILLREAIRLNPNASPSNLTEGALTSFLGSLGSTSPIVVNTRDIRNILNRLTLGSLKETFPGAISNDERRALADVSGVTAASREERARIMQRASDALERVIEKEEENLRKIRAGAFGRIDRTQGGTQ